jgi:hypothetical protein
MAGERTLAEEAGLWPFRLLVGNDIYARITGT